MYLSGCNLITNKKDFEMNIRLQILLVCMITYSFTVHAAPIVIDSEGGHSSVHSFPDDGFQGQTFIASETTYNSVGFHFDEVYGADTRDYYGLDSNFDLRFQLFEGFGWDGELLQSIDIDPGAGYIGFVDFDVSDINFESGEIYTAVVSAAWESGSALWMLEFADNQIRNEDGSSTYYDIYSEGVAIYYGSLDAESIQDTNFRALTDPASDGVFAAVSVPEPDSSILILLGFAGLLGRNRFNSSQKK